MVFRILIGFLIFIFGVLTEAKVQCREYFRTMNSPALRTFEALEPADSSAYESGWVDFKFSMSSVDDTIPNIKRMGREVTFLVKDGRYKGGVKLVSGYIYDIQIVATQTMSISEYLKTLTPKERRELLRTHRFGPNSKRIKKIFQVVLTTRAPNYRTEYTSGYARTESRGWSRKPRESTFLRVQSDAIVGSKYFLTY